MLFDALLFTITFLFSYYLYLYVTNRRKLPPGPFFFLPILGSHGAIVINDAQLLRKAFSLNSFSGRPHSKLFDTVSGNRKGFVLADALKKLAKTVTTSMSEMPTILSQHFLLLMTVLNS
ncbi:unnamed protein product [Allacma fusca]|uniref:Cytochrome P450 n=1 Tax=Allacma fusca TaxID=39272 RepID=A0A8J2L7V5_9HEXA|nr:unnamed protein product [Allacma fusca]